jgi:glycosyltransferase involved in cell wall biosynthesis
VQRLLLATDAYAPQVNGVVRTYEATIRSLAARGIETVVVEPSAFLTLPLPSYPDIRLALAGSSTLARRIQEVRPDAIHIATEGPIGWAARAAALRLGMPFTTAYHTRFPEYLSARAPVPPELSWAVLKHFHAPAARVMVSTPAMAGELADRGLPSLGLWPRGVDTALFRPAAADARRPALLMDLPRPLFLTVSRVAVEKNIEAFLGLDLPGSKVVVGDGPQRHELERRFPDVRFLGMRSGPELAALYADADAFVFPSLTDTYGIVLLEAAACGVPIAAFPVSGPRDVLAGSGVGVLDHDLRRAALTALRIPRELPRAFALRHSWAAATDAFVSHLAPIGHQITRSFAGRAA